MSDYRCVFCMQHKVNNVNANRKYAFLLLFRMMCCRKAIGAMHNGNESINFKYYHRPFNLSQFTDLGYSHKILLYTKTIPFPFHCFSDSAMHRDCPLDCKVYVGNLGNNGNKTELERSFGYYGPLRSVWVARNPPGFAFVEFEDPRDATDAVRELDGR